ncbi:unnamed protein product [Prorocentrum cordatum]|uniref:Uncharacterized protein n=1 Tax=Prorocentrum cordatum TaxID=2364126 RepID=A0ABN9QLN0_9DINO|nr:unnamed protein product [Polarella glacialis]
MSMVMPIIREMSTLGTSMGVGRVASSCSTTISGSTRSKVGTVTSDSLFATVCGSTSASVMSTSVAVEHMRRLHDLLALLFVREAARVAARAHASLAEPARTSSFCGAGRAAAARPGTPGACPP